MIKNFYPILLIFSCLSGYFENCFSMSKLYQNLGFIVIKNNRPCFYLDSSSLKEKLEGVQLYVEGRSSAVWSDNKTVINGKSKDHCIVLGDLNMEYETPKYYQVFASGNYGYADFCLAKLVNGTYYLAKGYDGKCTNEPEVEESDKGSQLWGIFKGLK